MTPPEANDCDPVERDSSNEEDDNDQVTGEGSEGDQEPHLDDVSASAAKTHFHDRRSFQNTFGDGTITL